MTDHQRKCGKAPQCDVTLQPIRLTGKSVQNLQRNPRLVSVFPFHFFSSIYPLAVVSQKVRPVAQAVDVGLIRPAVKSNHEIGMSLS